jgi:hypothetical protein
MDLIPIAVIGWLVTAACALALGVGAWLVIGLHLAGTDVRKHLAARVLDDSILFGIWILGLVGGIGLLRGKSWSPAVVQMFCWTLIALVLLSAWQRWRAAPPPRNLLLTSLLLFALPIIVFCGVSIVTLRSEAVVGALGG